MLSAETKPSSNTVNYPPSSTICESSICESKTGSVAVSDCMTDLSMGSVRPSRSKSKGHNEIAIGSTKRTCGTASSRPNVPSPSHRKYERKTKRFVWPEELHRLFVAAIFDVGLKNASPKALLLLMQSTGSAEQLTTEHLKSHLQKFRMNYERSRQEFLRIYYEQNAPTDSKQSIKKQSNKIQIPEKDSMKAPCHPMFMYHPGASRKRPRQWEMVLPNHDKNTHIHMNLSQSTMSPRLPKCVQFDPNALDGTPVAKSLDGNETKDLEGLRADTRPTIIAGGQSIASHTCTRNTTKSHVPPHIPQRAIYHVNDTDENMFDRNEKDFCQASSKTGSRKSGRIVDGGTQKKNSEMCESKSRDATNVDRFHIETEEGDQGDLLAGDDTERHEFEGDVESDPQWSILSSLLSPNITVANDSVLVSSESNFITDEATISSMDHDRSFTTAAERNAVLACEPLMLDQETSDVQTRMHLAMHAQMNLHRKMLSRKVAVSQHIWDDNQKNQVLADASSMEASSTQEKNPVEWAQSGLPPSISSMRHKQIRPKMVSSALPKPEPNDTESTISTQIDHQTTKPDGFFYPTSELPEITLLPSDQPPASLKNSQCDRTSVLHPICNSFSASNPLPSHPISEISEDVFDLERWGTLDMDVDFNDDDLFGFLKS